MTGLSYDGLEVTQATLELLKSTFGARPADGPVHPFSGITVRVNRNLPPDVIALTVGGQIVAMQRIRANREVPRDRRTVRGGRWRAVRWARWLAWCKRHGVTTGNPRTLGRRR